MEILLYKEDSGKRIRTYATVSVQNTLYYHDRFSEICCFVT